MTRSEAAAYLALDRHGLRDPLEALRWLCRTGRLRFTKVGRHICFRKAWLDEMLDRGGPWQEHGLLPVGRPDVA